MESQSLINIIGGGRLDALFHAGIYPADMAAMIQAVKDKYPK